MKKVIYTFISVFTILILGACTKEKIIELAPEQKEDTNEYFVHYEFPIYGSEIQYRDIDGELKNGPVPGGSMDSKSGLNITIGPVKKGFNCYLKGKNYLNGGGWMKIQVSKNSGVLVDKANLRIYDSGVMKVIEYTIDF